MNLPSPEEHQNVNSITWTQEENDTIVGTGRGKKYHGPLQTEKKETRQSGKEETPRPTSIRNVEVSRGVPLQDRRGGLRPLIGRCNVAHTRPSPCPGQRAQGLGPMWPPDAHRPFRVSSRNFPFFDRGSGRYTVPDCRAG